jgi:large repetitive protein
MLAARRSPDQTPLAPGASYQITRNLTIPGTAALGAQYLLFVTDASKQQSESDDGNNVHAVPLTIGAPDLTFASPPTAPRQQQ